MPTKIQLGRSAMHLVSWMGILSSLATPILHRFDTLFDVNVDFYFFAQHQWQPGLMPPGPKAKAIGSIILTAFATTVVVFGPLFPRWTATLMFMLILAALSLAASVANIVIGMHFYNTSPGGYYGGIMDWGLGDTFHCVAFGAMLVPIIALIVEKCSQRRHARAKASLIDAYEANTYMADAPVKCPDALIILPQLVAVVFCVAGAGAPQVQAYTGLGYLNTWHYDYVSSDYDIKAVKNLTCKTFYQILISSTSCAVVAAFFGLVAVVLNLLMPKRPLVATIVTAIGLLPAIGAAVLATILTKAIDCDNFWLNQGDLSIGGGLGSLYAGIGVGILSVMFGIITRNHVGDVNPETQSLLN